MIPFTWTNCFADVHTAFHGRTVNAYLSDVVEPALAAINAQIAEFAQSREGLAAFAQADAEALRAETLKAFALAIQSLWERQLRSYLEGCAEELKASENVAEDVKASQWARVERAFEAVRGIPLAEFPSYPLLTVLHLLGNVCRHGNGPSVARLHALRSDLFGDLVLTKIDGTREALPPSADQVEIELHHLQAFADAIAGFWEDAHTIYLQSLKSKHDNVHAKLAERRASGAWQPMRKQHTDGTSRQGA